MIITDEEKQRIVDFYKACNDMIDGRFILSDTKVSNILKCVVKSELLYNLYSTCMMNFNFSSVLDRCQASNPNNGGYFVMCDDEKEVVAFVTCLLLEVDKKNLSLQSFVTDNFFSSDGYNISYNNFAITILLAYKNAVKNLIGIDENGIVTIEDFGEDNIIDNVNDGFDNDETKILYANLVMNISDLQNCINEDYKIKYQEKEELLIILKALNKAVHIEDLLIINALLIPLEHMLLKHKKLRMIFDRVKILIADIYY